MQSEWIVDGRPIEIQLECMKSMQDIGGENFETPN